MTDGEIKEYINAQITSIELRYKNQLKYFGIGLMLTVTILSSLFAFTSAGNFIVREIVIKGLKDRPAISYEKTIVFVNEESGEGMLQFYATKNQTIEYNLQITPVGGDDNDIVNLVILINDRPIDSSSIKKALKTKGVQSTIILNEEYASALRNHDVHTLAFQYEAQGDLKKRVTLNNLLIVKD